MLPLARAACCAAMLASPVVVRAQEVLFYRAGDLAAVPPQHPDAATAIRALCRGPDAAQQALGFTTAVPPGTRLLAARTLGATLTLVFDPALLRPAPGASFEDAIEQIDKTALGDPSLRGVGIRVRLPDGTEKDLATLQGRGKLAPPAPPTPPAFTGVQGALTGRRIAISPGHGFYWHSTLGWTTQRGLIDGLIEDIHTAEICNQYLIPMLENLGAEVVFTREHGEVPLDAVVDNDQGQPAYAETGGWSLSASSGYNGGTYRFANATAVETATATWTIPVARDGLYPVYAWFRASSNRTSEAHYRVHHSGGVAEVTIDQQRDNLTWVWLGDWWFTQGQGARIVLGNQSPAAGVVIADAMRLGGGTGSIARGAGTSAQARWKECSRYWDQFAGAPSTVWDSISGGEDNDDDVTARPRFAEWRGADAFVSLHTNAGGGAGTSTYIYNGTPSAGSAALQSAVHTRIIQDLRAGWNASWTDRGMLSANFGEVRLLSTMPGILIELAFHDTPGSLDHTSLHQPGFRYVSARAIARGVMRYFAPTAPFVPEPPTSLRVTQDGARGLRVAWDVAAGATGYTVEWSPDGKGFTTAGTATATSWSTGPLPYHTQLSFRVRSTNGSGRSWPTEVLTAGTDHLGSAGVLLVQGFDRLDRYVKGPENTRDYLRLFGDAIRRDATFSLGFDAASNEAVVLGRVALGGYRAVAWSLGEESTADDTFSATEQFLVTTYLGNGGNLLATGAEIGWDLDAQGSIADRAFYRNQLGATYVADDANVHTLQAGIAGTVSAGMPAGAFDSGTGGTYDVDYPDVLAPTTAASQVCLRYGNGLVAGIQKTDPVTGARVVNLGFPLETMLDAAARARLLRQSLAFLLAPLPLTTAANAPLGARLDHQLDLPGEQGQLYLLCASEGMDGGVTLPGGAVLPLRPGFMLGASLNPANGVFFDFVDSLDAQGRANPFVQVPNLAFLTGFEVWFAGFTADAASLQARAVTNWTRVVLGP